MRPSRSSRSSASVILPSRYSSRRVGPRPSPRPAGGRSWGASGTSSACSRRASGRCRRPRPSSAAPGPRRGEGTAPGCSVTACSRSATVAGSRPALASSTRSTVGGRWCWRRRSRSSGRAPRRRFRRVAGRLLAEHDRLGPADRRAEHPVAGRRQAATAASSAVVLPDRHARPPPGSLAGGGELGDEGTLLVGEPGEALVGEHLSRTRPARRRAGVARRGRGHRPVPRASSMAGSEGLARDVTARPSASADDVPARVVGSARARRPRRRLRKRSARSSIASPESRSPAGGEHLDDLRRSKRASFSVIPLDASSSLELARRLLGEHPGPRHGGASASAGLVEAEARPCARPTSASLVEVDPASLAGAGVVGGDLAGRAEPTPSACGGLGDLAASGAELLDDLAGHAEDRGDACTGRPCSMPRRARELVAQLGRGEIAGGLRVQETAAVAGARSPSSARHG